MNSVLIHNPWRYLLFSLSLSAIGMGFAFAPSIAILHHYFEKRYNVAIGIAIAGYSFGDLIFPLVLQPMTDVYGWKGALFIMSALELNLVACGCVMKIPHKPLIENDVKLTDVQRKKADFYDLNNQESTIVELEYDIDGDLEKPRDSRSRAAIAQYLRITSESSVNNGVINDGYVHDEPLEHTTPTEGNKSELAKHITLHNLQTELLFKRQASQLLQHQVSHIRQERYRLLRPFRPRVFLLMLLVMLLHGIGWYAVIANLVPFAVAHNIQDSKAAELLTFIGVGSLVACLTQGWIIVKAKISSNFAKTISLVALTAITFSYPFSYDSYASMVTLSVFYGIAAGVSLSLFFALVKHLLPPEDVNVGISLVIVAEMLGDTIGGVLAGM